MPAQSIINEYFTTNSGCYLSTILNQAHIQSNLMGQGLPPVIKGTNPPAVPFNIGSTNSNLRIWFKGDGASTVRIIPLPSGTGMDCRMVARYITEQMQASPPAGGMDCWSAAQMYWVNDHFEIKSGLAGSNAQAKIESTTNSAAATLGFTHDALFTGSDQGRLYNGYYSAQSRLTNVYSGSTTITGTYTGAGYDEYTITAVENALKGGGATIIAHPSGTYVGNVTLGGIYNYHKNAYLHLHVTASGGSAYQNGIASSCPQLTWYMVTPTASGGVDPILTTMTGSIPLLFPGYPVEVGNRGLWVHFSNHPFDVQEAWTIECSGINKGSNYYAGQAERKVIWSSLRGDTQWQAQSTASPGSYIPIGKYGIHMSFTQNYPLESGDTFRVRTINPTLYSYDISSINLGNITVSTTSRVFTTTFGLLAGAVELTNVKFGLLDDGGMAQHNGIDTYFSFGTVGAGQTSVDGNLRWQWRNTIDKSDLTGNPVYLYATNPDLQEVSNADDSQTIGVNPFEGLISDYIFNAIRLGADESGAKTITYRFYFDYT